MSTESDNGVTGRRRRGLAAVVAVALAGAAFAGCGSGGGGSDASVTASGSANGNVAEAKRLVSKDEQPVSWTAPGPAIHVGDALRGKTLFYVAQGLNLPFTQTVVAGMKDAGAAVGLNFVITDGAGDASKASRLVDQAVSRKVDYIVIQAFQSSTLQASIRNAKAAGIPVLVLLEGDPQAVPADKAAFGVSAYDSFAYADAGRRLAHFVVADSGADANVVVFDVPDLLASQPERDGFINELERLCPDCKTKTVQSPIAQWETGLPGLTTSVLKADPTVNYLFALYDGMVVSMKPSLYAANAAERVKIVSYNADLPNMKALGKSDDPEAADVGGPLQWFGWSIVDQVARLALGKHPVDDEHVPNRTFTKENIGQIDLTQPEAAWYGNVDFRAKYRQLWGLG